MQERIVDKLQMLDPSFPLKQVHTALPCSDAPKGSYLQPCARILVIMAGNRRVNIPTADGPETLVLKKGDVVFALADTWDTDVGYRPYEMLCVVPRGEYLRVSHYDPDPRCIRRPPATFHHTNRPYSATMRNLLQVMTDHALGTPDEEFLRHLIRGLIRLALNECRSTQSSAAAGKAATTFVQIRSWVETSFQEDISRDTAAELFHLNANYISQLFKKMSGEGFHSFLTRCRMDFAEKLLGDTHLTVAEIAYQCGFRNHVHFVRRFRELKGLPPGRYRERLAAEP
jgi:AraC-like DNA-binding protein